MKIVEFENEKKVMGYLISYYRSQYGISVNDLLENKLVCSNNTYYKLIGGRSVGFEDLYQTLGKRLGKRVIFDNSMFQFVNTVREKLYDNLVNFDCQKLSQLRLQIINVKKNYENVLYIDEMLELYESIINYELDRTVPNHELINWCLAIRKNDFEDRKFVYYLLRKLVARSTEIKNSTVKEEVAEFLQDDLFFFYRLASFQKENNYDSLQLLKEYGENNSDTLNDYQKYVYYDTLANFQLNLEGYADALKSLEKCHCLISKSEQYSFQQKLDLKKHLAIVSFFDNDFLSAEKYFKEIAELDPFAIGFNYLMYCHSLEKNNHSDNVLSILPNYQNQMIRSEVRKIIMYYHNKYTMDLSDKNNLSYLENYILEDLLPCVPADSIYTSILKDDLLEYVSKSNNYKKIYLFESFGKRE